MVIGLNGITASEPVQNASMQQKIEEVQQLQEQIKDLTQKLEAEQTKLKEVVEKADEERSMILLE